MTTPDTSAVRAWAKENGYEVASRGRLPAEVTDAYLAANGTKTKAPAKKAASPRPTTARAAAPKPAAPRPAAAKRSGAKAAAVVEAPAAAEEVDAQQDEQPPAAQAPAQPAPAKTPRPKPSLVSDDRRLVALGEEIKALAARVEALEKGSGGSKSGSSSKATRFRRRS